MKRRDFIKASTLSLPLLAGCGYLRIDPFHPLLRSDVFTTLEQEQEIVSRAKVSWTDDNAIRVLHVQGSHYEMGYQQGKLLRKEVQDNIGYMYEKSLEVYRSKELFAEVFERIRPYISQEHIDEMHGLAHGARMPLETIHHIHALPSLAEWGGKKRLKKIVKQQMAGELGTSCSNFGVSMNATKDNKLYTVRILDWGLHRISKLHEYPLLTVAKPDNGIPYVNIGWVGFIGAVSGMNAAGITLGEMGYGDPPNETLRGKPMIFMLREILNQSNNLADVRKILKESTGTNSFGFLMSDGKNGDSQLYIKDRDRFRVIEPGEDAVDGKEVLPGIQNTVYGGHNEELMTELLRTYNGSIDPRFIREVLIPQMAMKSNFHNVLYSPSDLTLWINNAKNKKMRAAEQPYTFFDFGKALKEFV